MKQPLSHISLLFIVLLLHLSAAKPLKAMLYCYLPAVNKTAPMPEYANLVNKVNKVLQDKNINVEVSICDPNGNGGDLYNPEKINDLFDEFDIVEIDVMYISAVTVPLMKFQSSEIDYYDDVFPFEWDPVSRKSDDGKKKYLVGSPGLLCSDFKEKRKGDYTQRLYADYTSDYSIVSLYSSFYINGKPFRNLNNMNYDTIDEKALNQVSIFLRDCQQNRSNFVYSECKCLEEL